MRKIIIEGRKWEQLRQVILEDFAPEIKSCRDCHAPVAYGYSCDRCGSVEP